MRLFKPKKGILFLAIALSILCLPTALLNASTVKASTAIINTATANYTVGDTQYAINASARFLVDEIIDVHLSWQNSANVAVTSPSHFQVLRFLLTNRGNGIEDFIVTASANNRAPSFNPNTITIWHDSDGDNRFNPASDTLLDTNSTVNLDGSADNSRSSTVFLVSAIPVDLIPGQLSNVNVTATSLTARTNAAVGSIGASISKGGDGAVDAIIGYSGAQSSSTGRYEIITGLVSITKTAIVIDNRGGSLAYPGSIIRYTLSVNTRGNRPINHLIITDIIPNHTRYNTDKNSIRLNDILQTNVIDAPTDFCHFNKQTNTVTVDLSQNGTVNIVPPTNHIISFDVTIN